MTQLGKTPLVFVVLLLCVGAIVHAAALVGWKLDEEPLWTDVTFLCIDLVVFFGVLTKRRWGYWLALLLFLQQSAVQGYWAVWGLQNGVVFGIQQAAALLSVIALIMLVCFKDVFCGVREGTL